MARRLERKWRKTRAEEDKAACRNHQQFYRDKIRLAKGNYLAEIIPSIGSNSKALFAVTQEFLAPVTKVSNITPSLTLCEELASFFDQKVLDLRANISSSAKTTDLSPPSSDHSRVAKAVSGPIFSSFAPISTQDAKGILARLGPSSSPDDPFPTKIIKTLAPVAAACLSDLVNISFRTARVPDDWKIGLVTPLLKKPTLDPAVLKNFRPVTQLPLFARFIESVATQQLQAHCESGDLLHDLQSGFRPARGTESALLDIRETMMEIADQSHPVALVLLDLSAAFDTIDHEILLSRLQSVARVEGDALAWCRSFLSDRVQQVRLGSLRAAPRPAPYGVPQGSALSPLLFNIYMQPLAQMLADIGVRFQMYADDSQLLADLHPSSQDGACLLEGLRMIQRWMGQSWLCLNAAKTEVVIQGCVPSPSAALSFWPSELGTPPLPVQTARSLGVLFSATGTQEAQVGAVVSASHFRLNGLARLLPLLEQRHRALLCQALVISKIRYCCTNYVGLAGRSMTRLQRVQNRAVRLCYGLRRNTRISAYRRALGWMRITDQVELQALCFVWRALHGTGPNYLRHRFQWARPRHSPRHHRQAMLYVHRPRLARKGGASLTTWGPRWWNALPTSIRTMASFNRFKAAVKNHLRARERDTVV